MKILFFQFPLQPAWGGAETHTDNLINGLGKEHDVLLISSNRDLVNSLKQHGVVTQYVWIGWEPTAVWSLILFPLTFLAATIMFSIWLLRYRPQVVFCLSLTDKLLTTPLAKLIGIRVVWIEHTRIGRWLFFSPLRLWYVWMSRLVTVVAPSFYLRNQLIQVGVRVDNTKIIYPGINIGQPYFKPLEEGFIIGYLGRLAPEKGVGVLIMALEKLPGEVRLLIAGDGPQKNALKFLINKLGLDNRVEFLEKITKKDTFFAKIGVLVVPSILAESFGLVVVEAWAHKTPVVASRLGAIPEIIEHNKTGILFDPGNKGGLVDSLLKLKLDPVFAKTLATNAYRALTRRFDVERMLAEFRRLL